MKWIDRSFSFDFPADLYPEIIERLRGTPARARDRTRDVGEEALRYKPHASWSIMEHLGHLVSVESLFAGRLNDYAAGRRELRPADMTNRHTEQAHYNEMPLETIMSALRRVRETTVARLESLDVADFQKTATHPRLNTPMRLVDAMYFFAEHDDYHLARITGLIKGFMARGSL